MSPAGKFCQNKTMLETEAIRASNEQKEDNPQLLYQLASSLYTRVVFKSGVIQIFETNQNVVI